MKKITLIANILLMIFLAGCGGFFSLDGWICPDDLEFIKLIDELDTPQKIGNCILENFEYEERTGAHDPYTVWKSKKGNCLDFSIFEMFMAYQNNIEAYQIYINYEGTFLGHVLVAYVESGQYLVTSNQDYFPYKFDTFIEIVKFDSICRPLEWSRYVVRDYWNGVEEKIYNKK